MWSLLAFCLVVGVGVGVRAQAQGFDPFNFTDISSSPTVFETNELPADENGNFLPRYMASVGNGHVSTTVYTDTVYMNGLYDGYRGDSHRARIPSRNNIRIGVNASVPVTNHTYALDVSRGVFVERFSTPDYEVEQWTYAHRYYHKVLVTQIYATAKTSDAPTLDVWLQASTGDPSSDVNFDAEAPYGPTSVYQCGTVVEVENSTYQPVAPGVCVIATVVDSGITFRGNGTRTYFAAYDSSLEAAASDFNAVDQLVGKGLDGDLYQAHASAWDRVWSEGRIEVDGNLELAKLTYGCLYYILSSAPIATPTHSPVEQFSGLSPGGLAYGALGSDYQGHSFWDTETWMYPAVLYLFPEVGRRILSYRFGVLPAALDHANETGYQGARFPWESAATGCEVTPDCCPETSTYQIHVTGDVGYAVRQYVSLTRDLDWLQRQDPAYVTNGCGLLRDIAEFWASRATFNSTTRLHDILHVMPPDEDHYDVDNNGYTNVQAGYSIFFAKYAECLCNGSMEPLDDGWVDVASSLALLYDPNVDYHPEYEGYQLGESIKQADVVLMGFPLLYAMNASTRRNDLTIYANATRDDGPAMTWAMHTVGFLELDDLAEAEFYFNRSYQWYRREPFKIWTESKPPTLGAVNFLTGMGGFLQSVVSGYAGLRLYPEKMVFYKPRLLPHSTALRLVGLNYLGNEFDVIVETAQVSFEMTSASAEFPLLIESDGTVAIFNFGVSFPTGDGDLVLTIYSNTSSSCPLPLDTIGTPLPSSDE